MKKLLTIKEAVYTPKEKTEIKEFVVEHKDGSIIDPFTKYIVKVIINENKFNEKNCNKMKAKVNNAEFKSLFGPKAKPRKGDILSIDGITNKFRVKKSEKNTKKKSKGYNLFLKSV